MGSPGRKKGTGGRSAQRCFEEVSLSVANQSGELREGEEGAKEGEEGERTVGLLSIELLSSPLCSVDRVVGDESDTEGSTGSVVLEFGNEDDEEEARQFRELKVGREEEGRERKSLT